MKQSVLRHSGESLRFQRFEPYPIVHEGKKKKKTRVEKLRSFVPPNSRIDSRGLVNSPFERTPKIDGTRTLDEARCNLSFATSIHIFFFFCLFSNPLLSFCERFVQKCSILFRSLFSLSLSLSVCQRRDENKREKKQRETRKHEAELPSRCLDPKDTALALSANARVRSFQFHPPSRRSCAPSCAP